MIDRSSDDGHEWRPVVAGSPRAYAVVMLLVTTFILYGSLFPFDTRERSYPGGPFVYLLSTWRDWDHRGDLLSNILLYLPFGFFGTLALPSRVSARWRVLIMTVLGIALSCGDEVAQFHDVGRVTSMGDVYADVIGCCVGALAAAIVGASIRWPFIRELAAHPTASVLLVMFFGYRLYLYVPTIDLHKYWHAIRPILLAPSLPPWELARFAIIWLFVATITHSLYGFRRFLLLFPPLCGCEFLARILIIDDALKLTDVVGAGVAYLLWALLLRRVPLKFAIVTFAFAGMITAQRLEPFQFVGPPRDFGWVPFRAFFQGSINVSMQAFCEKFYQYGGLIWLLGRSGVALPVGTALTATLLFATSYAECWLPGRSAEITDTVMAVMLGLAFKLLRQAVRRPYDDRGADAAASCEQSRMTERALRQRNATSGSAR